MLQVYSLNDKAAKQLLMRMVLLLLIGLGMAAVVFFLGLKQWNTAQYMLVNAVQLLIAAASASALVILGGALDGKNNKETASLITLGVFGGVAVVAWIVLSIAGAHYSLSLPIFVITVVLAVMLCAKAFGMVKNVWRDLSSDSDASGNKIQYPGQYMLNEVHASDAITSPMGKVLIKGHAVLYVIVNQHRGHVLVRPNGTLEIRKTKGLFSNKTEETSIDYSEMTYDGARGVQRIMDIVKRECEQQGVDQPGMIYDYVIFLPNFQQGNFVFNEGSYKSFPFLERMGSYKQYLKKASTADYFSGRACFTPDQLDRRLSHMNAEFLRTNGAVQGDGKLVAESIAKACELEPRK